MTNYLFSPPGSGLRGALTIPHEIDASILGTNIDPLCLITWHVVRQYWITACNELSFTLEFTVNAKSVPKNEPF